MKQINRQHYPQLDKILWDTQAQNIEPTLAYQCYEQRWQFVEQHKLSKQEKALLEQLKQNIGNGLFMPANH